MSKESGDKFIKAIHLKNNLVISLKNLGTPEANDILAKAQGVPLSEAIKTMSDAFPVLTNELIDNETERLRRRYSASVDSILRIYMDAVEQLEADYARCQSEITKNLIASQIAAYEVEIDRINSGRDYVTMMNETD